LCTLLRPNFAAEPSFVNYSLSPPDVFTVTDRIIVMHRGRKIAEKITARTNAEELVQYMVGAREDVAD
jgi:ABC-type sugar transport system ATPase subunit